jgi:hypothetical protein
MMRTATCRCRGSAIDLEGEPVTNLICHCNACKRRTGGPCGWSAVFRSDQVRGRRGDFSVYVSDGAVGRTAKSFCSTCGTTLFFVPAEFAGLIGCAGGCFADEPLGEPTISASDDLRCGWLRLPDAWEIRTSDLPELSRAPGSSTPDP